MSLANISALASLESPRRKGNTVIFDAQIYVGSPLDADQEVLTASLRYYNENNLEFDEVGFYFIQATIARMPMESGVSVYSDIFTHNDFHLVGDITSIVATETKIQERAYVHVCGPIHAVNEDSSAFEIHANQYTTAIRDANNTLKQVAQDATNASPARLEAGTIRSFLPIKCTYPNTPRWATKLKLRAYSTVLIAGFLTGCEIDEKGAKARFNVEIDSLTLLGRTVPEAPRLAASPATPTPAAGKSKFKSQWGRTSLSPGPSPSVLGKRKLETGNGTGPNKASAPPSANLRSRG